MMKHLNWSTLGEIKTNMWHKGEIHVEKAKEQIKVLSNLRRSKVGYEKNVKMNLDYAFKQNGSISYIESFDTAPCIQNILVNNRNNCFEIDSGACANLILT